MALISLLILGAIAYWLALVVWTVWRLTHPPRRTFGVAVAQGRPTDPSKLVSSAGTPREFESWSIRADGCELPVWDVRGDDANGPVLILTHGWGDSRLGGLSRAHALLPCVSRCLLWYMPGHGDAQSVCALGLREVAALQVLLEAVGARRSGSTQDDPSPENAQQSKVRVEPQAAPRIVLHGWSLGAGASLAIGAWMASQAQWREKLVGVIAESPYRVPRTPAQAVLVMQGLPWRLTLGPALAVVGLWNRAGANFASGRSPATRDAELARAIGEFDRASIATKLGAVGVPVLVIHGTSDSICPIADGEAIAQAAKGAFVPIEGAGHFGLWTDPRNIDVRANAVREWLNAKK